MKYIISVLTWIIGIIGIIITFPLLALCFTFIPEKYKIPPGSAVFRLMVLFFLVRVRCEGRERLDRSTNYLFMANHASFIDLPILSGYLPGDKRGLEASSHFKWPVWGFIMRQAGMIPIDRSNARSSLKSIKKAADFLQRGISILILPEGTRSTTGRMRAFKKLPFKLAKMGGADIAPVGLVGSFRIKKKTSWLLRPGTVTMRFGEPIPADQVQSLDIKELMELTRDRIAELAEQQ